MSLMADDGDTFGRDESDNRNFGERPKKGAVPAKINVAELARGGGGTLKKYDDNFGTQRQNNVPKNLTNRVPGISELLEADSEVVRDLSRKPETKLNPRFLDQMRMQKETNRLDEKQDYLYDKVERDKRYNEREKLREERHRRDMLQRSKFHKEQAKSGEQVRLTLEEQGSAMISRTNQLGTMIEELRADFIEAQLEQQSIQKDFAKQVAADQCQMTSLFRWALFASLVTLALVSVTFFVLVLYPFIKRQWFSDEKPEIHETVIVDNPLQTKKPTALESSDEDNSLGI